MLQKTARLWAIIVILTLVGSLTLAGCGQKAEPPKQSQPAPAPAPQKPVYKVALLTSGPINDGGWNQSAFEGLQDIKKKFGLEVANTENVKQADQLQLIRSYVNQGYNIIFGHGFEYGDTLKAAAKEFPKAYFIQIGGIEKNGANLGSTVFHSGEAGYIAGIVLALTTKTNKIGQVGAMEIPTIKADFDNMKKAVAKYNPKATVVTAYTGSWEDIGKGKEAALAQFNSGVDAILADGDAVNIGVVEAAKEKKGLVVGWSRDQSHLGPEVVLTSMIQRVDIMMEKMVKDVLDGKFKGENVVMGFADGVNDVAPYNAKVPKDVQDKVKAVIEEMKSGKFDPNK
ncbi:MAG: BMP family protein [Firmicutes bacterium]|nr:BMP family protein [Bacillota bacterium]MCL5039236.1 BMP family protein [Bacillota bacterium]